MVAKSEAGLAEVEDDTL
jgi:hypothetical protein